MRAHTKQEPDFILFTDASGHWGCGAVQSKSWFQYAWAAMWQSFPIATKEMLPIVMALAVWGRKWSRSHLGKMWQHGSCKYLTIPDKQRFNYHALRSLHFLTAHWDIKLWAEHLPGKQNTAADALSRNLLQVFRNHVLDAEQQSTLIPMVLVELLVLQQLDWSPPSWSDKFKILSMVV